MEVKLSGWDYYRKDFVDPLYLPYQKKGGINPTKKQGYYASKHPELVRAGLGMRYIRKRPDDPCGLGWKDGGDGYCVEEKPEFEGTFYTESAHVPYYQYHGGYAPKFKSGSRRVESTDNISISPFTGEVQLSHIPKKSPNRRRYGHLPSKDSLLV